LTGRAQAAARLCACAVLLVLATIEAAYKLPRDGQAATATPIANVWLP
jgi:hypothetical protein